MPSDAIKISLLSRFLLKSMGYLVMLMLPWHVLAAYLAIPPTWVASHVMKGLFSWVVAVQSHGVVIELITRVSVLVPGDGRLVLGFIQPTVDFRAYGYGWVLLLALLLASQPQKALRNSVLGAFALVPVQAVCMCFHWLSVVLQGGQTARNAAGLHGWTAEFVAYGYQFGFLIATPLVPVIIWLISNQQFVKHLWLEMVLTAEMEREITRTEAGKHPDVP